MITTGNNNFFFSHKYDKETIQNISLTQTCFFILLKNLNDLKEDERKEFFSFDSMTIENKHVIRNKKQMHTYHFESNSTLIPLLEQLLFFRDDLNFYFFYKATRFGRSDVLLNKHTATLEYEFEFGLITLHIEFTQHKEENDKIIMENPKSITIEAIPMASNGIFMFNEPVGNRFYQDLNALNPSSLPINVFGQQMIKL